MSLSSDERREQILVAAIAVFGARGYEGTTTDEVARTAGVSQPYVVRLFGSKENLFLAAIDESSLDELMRAFRAALAEDDGEATDTSRCAKRIGAGVRRPARACGVCTRPSRTRGCWAGTR